MKVTREPVEGHEYVVRLTPDEATRVYRMFENARWDHETALELQRALGAACPDHLRRFFS